MKENRRHMVSILINRYQDEKWWPSIIIFNVLRMVCRKRNVIALTFFHNKFITLDYFVFQFFSIYIYIYIYIIWGCVFWCISKLMDYLILNPIYICIHIYIICNWRVCSIIFKQTRSYLFLHNWMGSSIAIENY